MRTALVWVFALATAIPVVHAQTDQAPVSGEPVRTYSLMREDEDWSFLNDPSLRQDFWDPIKYIRLGPDGWFLTIGGEAREALEQVGNDNWGKQNYTNTFFLERYMLHTDWHLGKYVRAFVQLQAGRQELNYGSGRLVSVREGPNVRQSFDGAKLKGKVGEWRIDMFATRPDLDKPGF